MLDLQRRLYDEGGLATEGIFRVAADGAQEQRVRHHLDLTGTIPEDGDSDDDEDGGPVDVHCLAGLIKAWFRELPGGLLDALPEEEVARCASEEEAGRLCARLAPAKAALLDWAVQLMADVASEEGKNRMGPRNVAMVFAPNMTQDLDPLTALKHTVHAMNFLNLLIERALRQRRQEDQKQKQPAA